MTPSDKLAETLQWPPETAADMGGVVSYATVAGGGCALPKMVDEMRTLGLRIAGA